MLKGENLYIVLAIILLIMMSAYFSATETAFSSLNKTRLRALAEKGNRRAKIACRLYENYDRLISTILIGNNIVNIAAASLGTVLFVRLCGSIGATVSTVVLTVTVLIFGEITPKSLAKDFPERFAMFSSPLLRCLVWIFTPLNFVFSLWKKLVLRLFKGERDTKMSQEELLMLVEEVQEEGSIDHEEGSLLRNAIEFSELRAEDILTHRVDLEAVSIESDKQEIAQIFTDTKFSRLPVYEETIDKIVGVIHQKDFYDGIGVTGKSIRELMTSPLFVLKSEKISELLRLLQENKSHVAVVLDEYGGTLGIVTLEDILEELVGEIWDEHDEVTEEFERIGENVWNVDCSVNLEDFCRYFDIETESESISIGGWVMECLEKIPEIGDAFTYQNASVRVTETDAQRILRIEVTMSEKVEEEVENE